MKVTRSAAAAHLLPSTAGRTGSRLDIVRSGGPEDEPSPIGRDAIAWAANALRRYEMPPREIGAVLGADNPELVRRYMQLHRERLEERLVDRLRAFAGLERFLVQATLAGRESPPDKRTAIHERERNDESATRESRGERPRVVRPGRSRKRSMPGMIEKRGRRWVC